MTTLVKKIYYAQLEEECAEMQEQGWDVRQIVHIAEYATFVVFEAPVSDVEFELYRSRLEMPDPAHGDG